MIAEEPNVNREQVLATRGGLAISFEILLTRSGSVCIHVENLQKLMIEIYKSTNHLSPSPWEFHEKKHVEYNLRKKILCKLPTIRSTSFGLESVY